MGFNLKNHVILVMEEVLPINSNNESLLIIHRRET